MQQSRTSSDIFTSIFTLLCSLEEGWPSHVDATEHPISETPDTRDHTTTAYDSAKLLESSKQGKSVFMTLHFLFPHELLPALDLLDRRLVTRLQFNIRTCTSVDSVNEVFYVRSTSAVTEATGRNSSSRFKNAYNQTKGSYEVRIDSWNCSCPAFAYSQMRLLTEYGGNQQGMLEGIHQSRLCDEKDWNVGGMIDCIDDSTPICKHILAALFVKVAPRFFRNCFEFSEASTQKIAALAAGLSDL